MKMMMLYNFFFRNDYLNFFFGLVFCFDLICIERVVCLNICFFGLDWFFFLL